MLAYPNRYWVAMSNLGFQTVYRLLRHEPQLKVERAFLPEEGEVRTFESNTALSAASILAISVSFETDYPHVLEILEAASGDIAVTNWRDRSVSSRPFVLGGGAALTLNAEPLGDFFDAIVIGEAEEVLTGIVAGYLEARAGDETFRGLWGRLSAIEGVYVPALFKPVYNRNGTVESYEQEERRGVRPRRRYLKDISRYPAYTVIQTPETEFKSMFMTETGRGCEIGCRFCVAGYMYRPVRKRSQDAIEETLKIGLEGSRSVGFVGAAVSSHPAIAQLASSVAQAGSRAALSSIMSQKVTKELAMSLSESEYKTVALAPEAGSERLRFRVGKHVCDEQIVEAVKTLASSGIRHFKLYFIVGLPSETVDDVKLIAALVEKVQASALSGAREQEKFSVAPTVLLSVNPFIPKAWTPFQRHAFMPFKEMKNRLALVRKAVSVIPNVTMQAESPRESYFQTLMSRGDRRVGAILRRMRVENKDWRWLVQNGSREIVSGVPSPDFYVYRTLGEEEFLPWESVDMLIKRSLLEREYYRTFNEDVTPLIARARTQHLARTGVRDN